MNSKVCRNLRASAATLTIGAPQHLTDAYYRRMKRALKRRGRRSNGQGSDVASSRASLAGVNVARYMALPYVPPMTIRDRGMMTRRADKAPKRAQPALTVPRTARPASLHAVINKTPSVFSRVAGAVKRLGTMFARKAK